MADYSALMSVYKKENPEYLGQDNEKIDKGVNFKIITRDDDKKEIYIKCIINYDKFIENIKNNNYIIY